MSFKSHIKPAVTHTENGMKAFVSTNDAVVDLFYHIGASRGKDILPLFNQAFNTDPELATRVALWARDVRGGAGERQLFRNILSYLEENDRETTIRVLNKVPELGRWDDLLVLKQDYAKNYAYQLIGAALRARNGLAAKWMPRQGEQAVELRKFFNFTPKRWRKTLVSMSNTVEQQMCAQDWNSINFDHVPSVAASRYQKAFKKRATEAYAQYVAGLKTGERKINASAVYPYDITKALKFGDQNVALAQWEALPNFIEDANWLPIVDVSGSMSGHRIGDNLSALDVAVGLGLYFADKNTGDFKDVFCEFSTRAKLQVLHGNLIAKYNALNDMNWDMSTDLHAAFNEILNHAVRNRIPERDMPKGVLILSDMQFNQCVKFDDSAFEMIRRKYSNAGHKVPKVVFWNLASRNTDNAPVTYDQRGVALVSGFSPAIFKSIASGKSFTPRDIMMETIGKDRYDF